jgi:hypothetical protein
MIPISKRPEYSSIESELNDIAAAQGKVEARITELEASDRAQTAETGDRHIEAALKFAETGVTEVPTDRQLELEILRKQARALDLAVRERHQTLNVTIGQLSREASVEVADKHRDIAARYLVTLRKLDSIAGEEVQLIRDLEKLGYSPSFPQYADWAFIGRIDQTSQSAAWQKVRELSAYVGK